MLDVGLVVTGAVIVVVLGVAGRWAPAPGFNRGEALDRLALPAVAGLLVARVATAALDDRTSLRSPRALLVIRGGAEFWVGVAVMVAMLAWVSRRRGEGVSSGLARLAPFALWGYAAYEATCLVRDGCYGPASAVGLVPDGLRTRMFPVGLVVAVAVAGVGVALRRVPWAPAAKLLAGVGGVAVVRSIVSFWLPRLGDGLTRQHRESILVAAGAVVVAAARITRQHLASGATVVRTGAAADRAGRSA